MASRLETCVSLLLNSADTDKGTADITAQRARQALVRSASPVGVFGRWHLRRGNCNAPHSLGYSFIKGFTGVIVAGRVLLV